MNISVLDVFVSRFMHICTMYDINFNFNLLEGAGVAGAVVYAALTFLISPKATLLIQVFIPLVMLATYFFILGKPGKILPSSNRNAPFAVSSNIQARRQKREVEFYINL